MRVLYGHWIYQRIIDYFYSKVSIPCDFKDNICVSERKWESNNKMCCCSNCYEYNGYLNKKIIKVIPASIKKEIYDNNFLPHFGYWREGVGCILPRKYRSRLCNFFICSFLRCSKSDNEIEIWQELDRKIRKLINKSFTYS